MSDLPVKEASDALLLVSGWEPTYRHGRLRPKGRRLLDRA